MIQNENKLMSKLQTSVSHELITPLKCIGSFSEELMALLTNEKPRYKAELIFSTS